jgi:hypothetical protein
MFKKISSLFNSKNKIKKNMISQLDRKEYVVFLALTDIHDPLNKKLNIYHKNKFKHLDSELFIDVYFEFFCLSAKILKINPCKDNNPLFQKIIKGISADYLELYYSLTIHKNYKDFFKSVFSDLYFRIDDEINLQITEFFSKLFENNEFKEVYNENLIQFNRSYCKNFFDNIEGKFIIKKKLENF